MRSLSPILLEICTASVEDSITAAARGADRIELNTALEVGGLTPSIGLLETALQFVSIPVIVMIRPRAGGFLYSDREFSTMQRDVDALLAAGASGIAFGILRRNGSVDVERCGRLVEMTGPAETVFHRAFDVVDDPDSALRELMDLGVSRILTSGRAASALEGAAAIEGYRAGAENRIEILPAGGITETNVLQVLLLTGCRQVHASLTEIRTDPTLSLSSDVRFRSHTPERENTFRATAGQRVRTVRRLLDEQRGEPHA